MDKTKADKIIDQLTKDKGDKELSEVLEQAQSIGISPPHAQHLLKTALEEDDVEPLLPVKNGKYRIDEKHFAIMFMDVFQQENFATGSIIPRYSMVGKLLGIPANTLRDWWASKESILAQQSTMMNRGMDYLSSALMIESMRMSQALSQIDYTKCFENSKDMKNFISLFNTLMNKLRLFSNRSTSNVDHQHNGGVEMILPD